MFSLRSIFFRPKVSFHKFSSAIKPKVILMFQSFFVKMIHPLWVFSVASDTAQYDQDKIYMTINTGIKIRISLQLS